MKTVFALLKVIVVGDVDDFKSEISLFLDYL